MRRATLILIILGLCVVITIGCGFEPPIPTIPLPTSPPSTPNNPTTQPSNPLLPVIPEEPEIPTTEVDIYNRHFDWPPEDPKDIVMTPTVIGFGWNLSHDQELVEYVHGYGAKFISSISLWNHDDWRTLEDLPEDMRDAYVTDAYGKLMYNQEMIFLNLMHPAYRNWQRSHVRNQIDQGVDGFVIDEIEGAASAVWMGGGLDEYSMAGFASYLESLYTEDHLKQLGVTSLQSFNYKKFLEENGLLDDYAQGEFSQLPLGQDYYAYLRQETQEFIVGLIDLAREYAKQKGRDIVITANFYPTYESPRSPIDEKLDYFTYEHVFFDPGWRAEEPYEMVTYGVPVTPSIRWARSQSKDAVVLMGVNDYGALAETGEPTATRLVLHAFAETYANLGYFCYFDLDYGFIGNEYAADHSELHPYYQFLREQPERFNGLESAAQVAVVLPPHPTERDFGPIDGSHGVAWVLSEINMDYAFVNVDRVSDFDLVFVHGYAWSDDEIQQLLDFMQSGGRVVAFDNRFASRDANHSDVTRANINSLKTSGTHTVGEGSFTFFEDYLGWKYYAMLDQDAFTQIADAARTLAESNSAPDGVQIIPYYDDGDIVIHCLNQNFDGIDFVKQTNIPIVINLPDGFVLEAEILKVISPDDGVLRPIPFKQAGNQLSLKLPSLYIWNTVSSK